LAHSFTVIISLTYNTFEFGEDDGVLLRRVTCTISVPLLGHITVLLRIQSQPVVTDGIASVSHDCEPCKNG